MSAVDLVAGWADADARDAEARREEHAQGLRSRRVVAAIERDLRHLVWGAGTDSELGAAHGVAPRAVRFLRVRIARDLKLTQVLSALEELAEIIEWKGSRAALLQAVLTGAIRRAREARQMRGAA